MKKLIIVVSTVLILTGCKSLSPETAANALRIKVEFGTFAEAVAACFIQDQQALDAVQEPWGVLSGLYEDSKEIDSAAALVPILANAPNLKSDAEDAYKEVKGEYIALLERRKDIECDTRYISAEATVIEDTYDEITDAIEANDKAMTALRWGTMLAKLAANPQGELVKLALKAAVAPAG